MWHTTIYPTSYVTGTRYQVRSIYAHTWCVASSQTIIVGAPRYLVCTKIPAGAKPHLLRCRLCRCRVVYLVTPTNSNRDFTKKKQKNGEQRLNAFHLEQ